MLFSHTYTHVHILHNSLVLFLSQSEINTSLISCLSHKLTNSATVLSSIIQRINEITAKLRNPEPRGGRCERKLTFASYWWTTPDPPPQTERAYSKQEFCYRMKIPSTDKGKSLVGRGKWILWIRYTLDDGISRETVVSNTIQGVCSGKYGSRTISEIVRTCYLRELTSSWCGWFIICHGIGIINSVWSFSRVHINV